MIRGCFHKLHVVVPLRSGNADSCEYPRIPSNTHRIPFSRAPEYPLNTPTVTMPTYLKICILGVLGRIYSSMLHVISTFQLVCCYGFFRAGLGTRRANEGDCCRMKYCVSVQRPCLHVDRNKLPFARRCHAFVHYPPRKWSWLCDIH